MFTEQQQFCLRLQRRMNGLLLNVASSQNVYLRSTTPEVRLNGLASLNAHGDIDDCRRAKRFGKVFSRTSQNPLIER